MSKQTKPSKTRHVEDASTFVPLLNGSEKPQFVKLREELYEKSWAEIDGRIQVQTVLLLLEKDANSLE